MDGRMFDDLVRSFASRSNRRRVLRRGAAIAAAVGGLGKLDLTSAARRGYSGTTSLCVPLDGGGFERTSVKAVLAPFYLGNGAILDQGCCSDPDCNGDDGCSVGTCDAATGTCALTYLPDGTACTPAGPIDLCIVPYLCLQGVCSGLGASYCSSSSGCTKSLGCNPNTGLCEYGPSPDGSPCFRRSGCVDGICENGECIDPPSVGCESDACFSCHFDSCLGECFCTGVSCIVSDPDCQDAHCDPEIGCVTTNKPDDVPCGIAGLGICKRGDCVH